MRQSKSSLLSDLTLEMGIFRNPPSLDYSRGKVGILLCRDPNAVRVSDRVRKALQQLGQEGWEFQSMELLSSWHAREWIR